MIKNVLKNTYYTLEMCSWKSNELQQRVVHVLNFSQLFCGRFWSHIILFDIYSTYFLSTVRLGVDKIFDIVLIIKYASTGFSKIVFTDVQDPPKFLKCSPVM